MASHALPIPPCTTTCSPPRPLPSRLVAAYHTSVKRHSVLAMKSLYVRTYVRSLVRTYVRVEFSRTRVRGWVCARARCESVRESEHRERTSISIPRRAYELFIPPGRRLPLRRLPCRSSNRFSARMTVYESLFSADFFRFPFPSISAFLLVRSARRARACENCVTSREYFHCTPCMYILYEL